MAASVSWNNLPDVALLKIFSHLCDTDRFHMGLSCKNWYRLLSIPSLWRYRKVIFSGLDAIKYAKQESAFLKRYGQYLHGLSIGFNMPSFRTCRVLSMAADDYLRFLRLRRDVCLKEICLDYLNMENYWHFILSRNRVVTAICRFLRRQRHLLTLYMAGARMTFVDGCRVLEALGSGGSANTLKTLYMEEFFHSSIIPVAHTRYTNAMTKFLALKDIRINYKCLNTQLLQHFCRTFGGGLNSLTLMLDGDLSGMQISSDVWREIKTSCPQLQVEIYIYTSALRSNPTPVLVRGMPLIGCHIESWTFITVFRDENLPVVIRHLADAYSDSLELLSLHLERHTEIDDVLIYLLEKCKNLKDLCLYCRLSVDSVETICRWQREGIIALETLDLCLNGLTTEQWSHLNGARESLLAGMNAQSVHIRPLNLEEDSDTSSGEIFMPPNNDDNDDDDDDSHDGQEEVQPIILNLQNDRNNNDEINNDEEDLLL